MTGKDVKINKFAAKKQERFHQETLLAFKGDSIKN